MTLDSLLDKKEILNESVKVWSEESHFFPKEKEYYFSSVNLKFFNGDSYEFIDRKSYDGFGASHHKTVDNFGNKYLNKLKINL